MQNAMLIRSFNEIIQSKRYLDKKSLVREYGNKSASLIELKSNGFSVPNFWCLSEQAFLLYLKHNRIDFNSYINSDLEDVDLTTAILSGEFPEQLQDELSHFFDEHSETYFAIRSSSSTEDMADASFAGLYSSYLNQKGYQQGLESIKRCWASAYESRVLKYCRDRGIPYSGLTMTVLIQEMICAEKSGVAFSINPVKGTDTEVYIEAVHGLGEVLVAGEVTPDQYTYDWFYDNKVDAQIYAQPFRLNAIKEIPFVQKELIKKDEQLAPVLSNKEVKTLANEVVKIQSSYGYPVDVEWVMRNNSLYIVQARPVTNIQYTGLKRAWTTADFKDGGVSSAVCTAFMASLYKFVIDHSLTLYMESIRLKGREERETLVKTMYGRPYWNASYVKEGGALLPGFVERKFDEDLGVSITYEGEGKRTGLSLKSLFKGLSVLAAIRKSRNACMDTFKTFPKQQQQVFEKLNAINFSELSKTETYSLFQQLIHEYYYNCETAYFRVIYDNSNQKTLFTESFDKLNCQVNFLKLLGGLKNLSHLQANFDLWDISRAIINDSNALSYWKNTSSTDLRHAYEKQSLAFFSEEIKAYIRKYCYLSTRQLDVSVENLDENPEFIFNSLKHMLLSNDANSPQEINKKQYQSYLYERDRLKKGIPFYKRKRILKHLDVVREFLWHREEFRDYSTRMYYFVRKFTLAVGEQLVKNKVFDNADEVFHLSHQEISQFIDGKINSCELRSLYLRNRDYYKSFERFQNTPDIGMNYGRSNVQRKQDNVFHGIPCSAGLVHGRVKIVHNVDEINRLEQGDILVTRFTDPGWTPVFGLLSAVITETGGLLSHAAVISREYGIPAILAIDNITQYLRCGQKVSVNGNTGEVHLISE